MTKVSMGPPPSRSFNPTPTSDTSTEENPNPIVTSTPDSPAPAKVPMGPPPPISRNTDTDSSSEGSPTLHGMTSDFGAGIGTPEEVLVERIVEHDGGSEKEAASSSVPGDEQDVAISGCKNTVLSVPYSIPTWSEHPGLPFYVEVLKEGAIIDQLDMSVKGAYMFGRVDSCDFVLEHPTISRFHAVIQFKKTGEAFLYDLGSTHGTSLNKKEVKKKVYTEIHVGNIIRFGQSSRLYIFQGPSELMPQEGDLKKLRQSNILEEIQDREASLLRARVEASLANGISWGMAEDAAEDSIENDAEEITWQTYKGQLTERQEKTRGKIIKRLEKVANMRKEIDAIRAKDISQGGLTQGQQTQIARNEQRTSQIMEELDSLEETLNESIRESLGARSIYKANSKKGIVNNGDEDEFHSDDDEFYDRTKMKASVKKSKDQHTVETADTLLDKKEAILRDMGEKKLLLQTEETKPKSHSADDKGEDDALDAYMSGLSSKLAIDTTVKIQEEISSLQSELDRILYLLKLADPSGEAARKRTEKSEIYSNESIEKFTTNESSNLTGVIPNKLMSEKKKPAKSEFAIRTVPPSLIQGNSHVEEVNENVEKESKTGGYTITKPQWLGAVKETQSLEAQVEGIQDTNETDNFIDYKERKKVFHSGNEGHEIRAASGLILRKRKHIGEIEVSGDITDRGPTTSSAVVETSAADAIALLLKHKRGYFATDEEVRTGTYQSEDNLKSQDSHSKRVLGPEKPAFLEGGKDYESWVPPEGQSGDGRTSLNDKLGY